jgi:AraC family transcriptional regulator
MATEQRGGIKPFGTGRAALWRGGIIWIGTTEEGTDFHAHHAIQVTLALSGGEVCFRRPGEDWTPHKAALVTANQSHAFEARGELVALILAEPESREGRAIKERYSTGIASLPANTFEQESKALAAAFNDGAPDAELLACARAVISKLSAAHPLPAKPLDKRIERAIALLRERPGDAITMAGIADAVHLSPERFRHLFIQETGIRFRPYVLWLRLELAVACYAAGNSLTEAAHSGGFADSAHFSRTFKRMFGVPAMSVRRE